MISSTIISLLIFLNLAVVILIAGRIFAKKEILPEKIDILNERISVLSGKIDQLDKRINSQDKAIENIESVVAIIANSHYLFSPDEYSN